MAEIRIAVLAGKRRVLAAVFLVAAAFIIGCSNAAAPERPTAVPQSPAPPASDIGATVDALVSRRLSAATKAALAVISIAAPTADPAVDPIATPTASPDESTPAGGGDGGTATPEPTPTTAPTPTVSLTPTVTPTATLVPTATPTFDDDHGDSQATATAITLDENLAVITGEIDVLDDIDFFAITNDIPGRTWVFTPEYLPPETASGRYPTIDISGASFTRNPFTGVISFQPGGGTIFLSVTSAESKKTGNYRVVIDRTVN